MEKRLLLAVVLMAVAMVVTNILFPPPEAPIEPQPVVEAPSEPGVEPGPAAAAPLPSAVPQALEADSVVVESDLYRYVFSTRGAGLRRAEILGYPSYSEPGRDVQLVPDDSDGFLSHRLVIAGDTIDLRGFPFAASRDRLRIDEGSQDGTLEFSFVDDSGFSVTIAYAFEPNTYLLSVSGRVEGLGGRPADLLTSLGPGLENHEHPDHHSERESAVVTHSASGLDRLAFNRIDQRRVVEAPLTWAGLKDKYFLAVVIGGEISPLTGVIIDPAGEATRELEGELIVLPRADLNAVVPVAADGTFAFDSYLGPQDYGRLSAIGYDLEEVTPYGYRWLQPIIRPLAAAVLWVLNTLHDTLGIAYGWVLVIFGVMMRVVLWPLNAKAMRAQLKNMGVQPLLQEIREKYKNDPQKQQEAMLALYKEHGFNPLAGCLPMLVPFPVLITLFFVFQNTIAFRGAGFLWLPDLSLRDPFYILPFVLVVSMFALQWVMAHLSGMEQNPQMKMMMYFMPIMMGVIFFMLPSGLNLYYAVTQVASIPQQVLIARERRRAQEEMKKKGGPKLSPPSGGGKKKPRAKR